MSFLSRVELDATIGNTPMREIRVRMAGHEHRILMKLESANGGGGSIKARTVRGLLDRAAAEGLLRKGTTVIESSSGNFASALALQGQSRGLKVIVVLDPRVAVANLAKIEAAGAVVEKVDTVDAHGGYLTARLERVSQLMAQRPGSFWTNQYGSVANPDTHYFGTGLEIVLAAPDTHAIMVPCSTGGTVAGIAARVRASGIPAEVVPVDIPGSYALRCGEGRRLLTGIGSAQSTVFVRAEDRARSLIVDDGLAIAACRELERYAGISVGGSSGAAFVAALRWLEAHPSARTVVVVCPDSGANYDFSDKAIERLGIRALPSLDALVEDLYVPLAGPARALRTSARSTTPPRTSTRSTTPPEGVL